MRNLTVVCGVMCFIAGCYAGPSVVNIGDTDYQGWGSSTRLAVGAMGSEYVALKPTFDLEFSGQIAHLSQSYMSVPEVRSPSWIVWLFNVTEDTTLYQGSLGVRWSPASLRVVGLHCGVILTSLEQYIRYDDSFLEPQTRSVSDVLPSAYLAISAEHAGFFVRTGVFMGTGSAVYDMTPVVMDKMMVHAAIGARYGW